MTTQRARWTEHHWFEVVLAGRESRAPYTMEDPDADWRIEEGETLAGLLEDYREQCEISREILADLDQVVPFRGDRTVSARWVLAHVIEETAQHAGHLDVVRELLDGSTGDWAGSSSHSCHMVRSGLRTLRYTSDPGVK